MSIRRDRRTAMLNLIDLSPFKRRRSGRGSFSRPWSDIGFATAGAVIQPLRKCRVLRALSMMRCMTLRLMSDSFAGPAKKIRIRLYLV